MPLKLPAPLKNLLSSKHGSKSGTKNTAKNKTTKKGGRDNPTGGNLTLSTLQESEQEDSISQQELRHFSVEDFRGFSELAQPCDSGEYSESVTSQLETVVPQRRIDLKSAAGYHNMSGPERNSSSGIPQKCGDNTVSKERMNAEARNVETLRQISTTSDYKSMTPTSSIASEMTIHHGNPADPAQPAEGLPDLPRSLENMQLGGSHSAESSVSTDSGLQWEYPTVIERKRNFTTSKKTAASSDRSSTQPQNRETPSSGFGGSENSAATASPVSLQDLASGGLGSSPSSRAPGNGESSRRPAFSAATAPIASRRPPDGVRSSSSATAPVMSRASEVPGAGCPSQLVRPFSSRGADVDEAAVERELFPESALHIPVGALRKSRKRLCLMLNLEQLAVDTEFTPDYMGLAEMVGFDALEIQNFWERNPSDTLFLDWSRAQDSRRFAPPVLKTLVSCLEQLGRSDILMECRGLILEDVSVYIAEQRLLDHYAVSRLEQFDCYVNIAEQDLLGIGREIVENLEGVHGLRLCLTLRDVTLGGFEYEEMAKMLETRCDSKVVIVLSKNYEDSDACQFLTQFAVTLDPGSRRNKLIPLLVDEDTCIPRVLRCLAMLNFHRDKRLGFLWPRLRNAIKA